MPHASSKSENQIIAIECYLVTSSLMYHVQMPSSLASKHNIELH